MKSESQNIAAELPPEYLTLTDQDYESMRPWYRLQPNEMARTRVSLRARYPERNVIPFAKREDSDDIACYEPAGVSPTGRIVVIHDYASPGWELSAEYPSLDDWMRDAAAGEI